MEKILVIIGATLLISFIVWWFFGKRDSKEVRATMYGGEQKAKVTVNGGYLPNTVVLRQGVPARLIFDRKDPSSCFSSVVFPDFGINQELPVNEEFSIDIDTSKVGEFDYACGMNMFHGKIVVK